MAFNMFSILLLLEIFYISNAVLLWPIQSDFYASIGRAFDETDEIQNKPVESSENEPIKNLPISNLQEHQKLRKNSLGNRQQEEKPIIRKVLVRSLSESLHARSKNTLRKSHPLCFFSALPCTPRRKDVYYAPRRVLSEMILE